MERSRCVAVEIISIGQSNIEVRSQGSGQPVVLFPGLAMDGSMYDDLAQRLNNVGFKTVVVNPRGTGKSMGPLDGLTLHDFASDVAGVIEALGLAPVHLLGAAFGNRVMRCVAQHYPGLCRSVVLISAGGLVPPEPDIAKVFQKLLLEVEGMTAEKRAEAARLALFSPATEPEKVTFSERIWFGALRSQVYAAQITELHEWWAGGSIPMLVVQGLDDRVAPPANGRDLHDKYKERVTLVELENAGHAILSEKPQEVADAIFSFLRSH